MTYVWCRVLELYGHMELDIVIRLGVMFGAFALFAGLEWFIPNRTRTLSRRVRWPGAWLLVLVSGPIARLVLPAGLAGVAFFASSRQLGVFNVLELPGWIVFLLSVLLLDVAVWFQHVLSHKVPILWRLHRVHHSDPEVDVTTAFRFHPLEIALSALFKALVVLLIGAPAAAAFCFEVILNASAQFNHANIKLPQRLDQLLRWFMVTPDMHRVHHSVLREESDSNYGFFLSFWDRAFGVYRRRLSRGANSPLGQSSWRDADDQRIDRLLLQPFKEQPYSSDG